MENLNKYIEELFQSVQKRSLQRIPQDLLEARKKLSLKRHHLDRLLQSSYCLKRTTFHKILKEHHHAKIHPKPCFALKRLPYFRNRVSVISFDPENPSTIPQKLEHQALKEIAYNFKALYGVIFSKESLSFNQFSFLSKSIHLKYIEIASDFNHIFKLSNLFAGLKKLRSLKITMKRMTENQKLFHIFCKSLSELNQLERIDLSLRDSSSSSISYAISPLLSTLNLLPNLSAFNLYFELNTYKTIDFSLLQNLLSKVDCLQLFLQTDEIPQPFSLLNKNDCQFSPTHIQSSRKLTFNILYDDKIDFTSLITACTSLSSLSIYSAPSLQLIKNNFKLASTLKNLIIQSPEIEFGDMKLFLQYLHPAMSEVTSLEELSLSRNFVGSGPIYRLNQISQLPAIKDHTKVFKLELETSKVVRRSEKANAEKQVIYGDMFKDLEVVLMNMENLEDLKLNFNQYSLKSIQELDKVLEVCPRLKALKLNMNSEGDFEAREFEFPFEKMRNLRELSFRFGMALSQTSKDHFLQKIHLLDKLDKLEILDHCFDQKLLMKELEKLPALKKVEIKDKTTAFSSNDFQKYLQRNKFHPNLKDKNSNDVELEKF